MLLALPLATQPKKHVFLITDAEGVAGVCRQEQTDAKNQEMRQLLTGEINAAVQGFLDGGDDEVTVWDGHDGHQTLSALTIHPRAKLIMGDLGITMSLERHYSAMAFIGQHARANSRGGVMAHSFSSLGIQKILMNGKPVGEIETNAAMAGYFNTPTIMLSGDQQAAANLKAIVPNAEVAVVKEGLANYSCITMSAEEARRTIHDAAKRSVSKIDSIKPYRVEGTVTIEIERTSRSALGIDAGKAEGVEMLDARTIRATGKDFLEAWKRSRMQ